MILADRLRAVVELAPVFHVFVMPHVDTHNIPFVLVARAVTPN